MSTDDIDLLNDRISKRKLLGDHYVRPEIVAERYIAGLKLLNHYFKVPDFLQLFDNSIKPILKLVSVKGSVVYKNEPFPNWIS